MVADSFDGLDGSFASRLRQMINESGGRFWIFSGYRSIEDQTELWNNALAKYGSEDAARQWVAPPGKSNHNHGWAADLAWANDDAREWAHANAAKYGLTFPMDWEPWHIEPLNSEAFGDRDAYTTPPTGYVNPQDALAEKEDPYDQVTHFRHLIGMMAQPVDTGIMATPAAVGSTQSIKGPTEPEALATQVATSVGRQ